MTMTAERMTTVKVSVHVRDQLNAIANAHGQTANSVIEDLLRQALRSHRMSQVRQAMADASEEDIRTYREETEAWIAGTLTGNDEW